VIALPRAYNAATHFVDRHVAEGRGARVAFRDDAGSLTYGELAERTARVAGALRALGVEPEQRVALCMLDTVDFPCVFWGAVRAGVVPVPLNTLLTTADYAYMLADSRARVVFVSDVLADKVLPAVAQSPHVRKVVRGSELAALLGGASGAEAAPTCCDDVAFWLYS
jgi:acyl-CoA synthetase (AMP-forming)/AMP-acid ligase II